jgi:hypothetical protein
MNALFLKDLVDKTRRGLRDLAADLEHPLSKVRSSTDAGFAGGKPIRNFGNGF